MKADIGLSEKNLQSLASDLNILLADEHVLYVKTRNYHWNVEGSNFSEMHLFYEKQYTDLAEKIDEIAENIRYLGHFSEGRMKDYLKLTNLEEQEYTTVQKTQISNLLSDHETIIKWLNKKIAIFQDDYKSASTADFITGVLQMHQKMAWMLRAYTK